MNNLCKKNRKAKLSQRSGYWHLILMFIALLPFSSHAINLRFLDTSLMAQLSDEDVGSLKAKISDTLDKSPDQKIITWESTTSGIRTQIKPKVSYTEGARDCRRTLFKLSKDGVSPEYYHFDICKTAEGKWQVSDSLMRSMNDGDWLLLRTTVHEVLESDKSNKLPSSWYNTETQISGVAVPITYLTHEGKTCREVAISVINTKGSSMDGHYTFCKVSGTWERLESLK